MIRLLLTGFLLLGALLPEWAQAQSLSNRPMREGFGLVVKFQQGQPAQHLDLLPTLGVSWVRDTVMWHDMEPKAGEYQPFPAAFQRRLERYRQANIGVIYFLAYANGRAYPKTPQNPLAPIDPKALGRYAAHVTKLLQKAGVKFVIQVWNEPQNFQIREMVGGDWNGRPPSPWVDFYIEMVKEVKDALREIAPSVQVITSEDVWVNHYWFARSKRLPADFNGIGLHAYTDQTSTGPEVVSPYENSEWAKPFQVVEKNRSFSSAIGRLKAQFQDKNRVPEVWITEWGYKLNGKFAGGVVTEAQVAAFLPRAFVLAEAADVKALCWFSMQDVQDGPYGLLDNKGRQRPAFHAYQAMNEVLGDFTLRSRLSPIERQVKGVQAFLFQKGSRQRLAIWSADNARHRLKVDPKWGAVKVWDVYGETLKPSKGEDGQQLDVGSAPIYVELGEGATARWSETLVE